MAFKGFWGGMRGKWGDVKGNRDLDRLDEGLKRA